MQNACEQVDLDQEQGDNMDPQKLSIDQSTGPPEGAPDQKIAQDEEQRLLLLEAHKEIRNLMEKIIVVEQKLETATREKVSAVKEKEAMVIKYAVSEKHILEQKQAREQSEKKYRAEFDENQILQNRIKKIQGEKTRICQLLDDKTFEQKTLQHELDKVREDLAALELKHKWTQNGLRAEIEAHKDTQSKLEAALKTIDEANSRMEQKSREAADEMKKFYTSQDNRAFVLEQQMKEQHADLILMKHEREAREALTKNLQGDLERLQAKQNEVLQENNGLSLKVQQLEHERLETDQRISDLRAGCDRNNLAEADLESMTVKGEQLRSQLEQVQSRLRAEEERIEVLKLRNCDLEADSSARREREAELLHFTQQLTEKNVRLQSEFTALETRVQQLTAEKSLLDRSSKEHETRINLLQSQLTECQTRLSERTDTCQKVTQEIMDSKEEKIMLKRKYELSLKELSKELHHMRNSNNAAGESSPSNSSSNSSSHSDHLNSPNNKVTYSSISQQTLLEHIVKLQKINAKKSEKIDFLEEHINSLIGELQQQQQKKGTRGLKSRP